MNILDKIRSFPEIIKKIILFFILAVAGFFLLRFYFGNLGERMKKIEIDNPQSGFELPDINLEEQLQSIPSLEDLQKGINRD